MCTYILYIINSLVSMFIIFSNLDIANIYFGIKCYFLLKYIIKTSYSECKI